ncbi:MAG: CCA tRNA nucleotidyltransferase [bacterium]
MRDILEIVKDEAKRAKAAVYLVGGAVRDRLLGVEEWVDLDLAVEGDAVELARRVAGRIEGDLAVHPAFGTAALALPGGAAVDFASTRKETYPSPGALPKVSFPATIREDLLRRDFTINAMAMDLETGEIIDPLGGVGDIERRLIRVLHEGSFIDDPTRIFRAIRYEGRLGFNIEERTLILIREALDGITSLSGERLWNEIFLILNEERAGSILKRMEELGVLTRIYPKLKFSDEMFSLCDRAREKFGGCRWMVRFLAMADNLSCVELEALEERLNLPSAVRRDTLFPYGEILADLPARPSNREVYRILHPLSPEAQIYLLAKSGGGEAESKVLNFIENLREIELEVDGGDAIALGIPEGPMVGEVLERVLDAKLEGEVSGREEEVEYMKRIVRDLKGNPHY